VRHVAPKLIANGESHRPLREAQPSSGSQDWAVTWQGSARGEDEGGELVGGGATAERHACNTHSRERDRGRRVTEMQECPRGTVEEST
jgi:hypothetical protein